MRRKQDPLQPLEAKPSLLPILSLCLGVLLCAGAALYALFGAATQTHTLYDASAQNNKTTASLIFESLADSYQDDLRTLHLKVEAQSVRFDELTQNLTAKTRQNGFDYITTIIPRGTGYVNILDSRFMRGLTPNVDYNTVGSHFDPKAAGGTSLERAVNAVAFEQRPYAYAVVRNKDGNASLVTVMPLTDLRNEVIGLALVTTSTGLVASIPRLVVPYYVFGIFFGAVALFLLLKALIRLYQRRQFAKSTALTNPSDENGAASSDETSK